MSHSEDTNIIDLACKLIRIDAILGNLSRQDRIDAGIGSNKTVITIEEKHKLEHDKINLMKEYYSSIIELDRVCIKRTPDKFMSVNFLRNGLLNNIDIDEFFNDYKSEIFEYHQDDELLDRATFICNYYTLKPPYVSSDAKIPDNIRNIYHESRWCFVFCQYNASIVLSRTIIETVLQQKLKDERSIKDLIDVARDRNVITIGMRWKLNKVRLIANKILHKADVLTKKEALSTLDSVLEFIEEMYLN